MLVGKGRFVALAAAFVAFMSLGASEARAQVTKKTSGGDPVRWGQSSVMFTVDPALTRAIPNAEQAVAMALDAWSAKNGAPGLAFATAREGDSVAPAKDGRNVIYYAPSGHPLVGGALAVTILTYDDISGRILDADIIVNGAYPFAVLEPTALAPVGALAIAAHTGDITPSPCDATGSGEDSGRSGRKADARSREGEAGTCGDREHKKDEANGRGYETEDGDPASDSPPGNLPFDLTHVLAHDLGHALGLGDDGDHRALMYLYSLPGDASRRGPSERDLEGLRELYADGFEGDARCSIGAAPGATSRGAGDSIVGSVFVLAGVASAAVRRMKRKAPVTSDGVRP
jgi:hypothetical protein